MFSYTWEREREIQLYYIHIHIYVFIIVTRAYFDPCLDRIMQWTREIPDDLKSEKNCTIFRDFRQSDEMWISFWLIKLTLCKYIERFRDFDMVCGQKFRWPLEQNPIWLTVCVCVCVCTFVCLLFSLIFVARFFCYEYKSWLLLLTFFLVL